MASRSSAQLDKNIAPFGIARLSIRYRNLAVLVLAILIWGINWPVMKAGLAHITPVWFSALRFLSGALCLFILQAVRGTLRLPTVKELPTVFIVGFLQMMAFTLLGSLAMIHVQAGRSAILAYTTPLWVVPFCILVLGERISRAELLGTLLGAIGVVVLFNPFTMDWTNHAQVTANFMLLGGSCCWAICILHLRNSKIETSAYLLAPWQMLVAAAPLMTMARTLEGPFSGDGSGQLWSTILYVGPLATAFCFCAVNAASKALSSTTMSTTMLGVPLVGLLASMLWQGEKLSFGLLIGLTGIVAGIGVVTLVRTSKEKL